MRGVARLRGVVGAAAFVCAALLVFSAQPSAGMGLYLAADLGTALSSSSDLESAALKGRTDFDAALEYNVALGLGLGPLRLEGQASWLQADLDSIEYSRLSVGGQPLSGNIIDAIGDNVDVKGKRSTVTLMANAWYDVELALGLTPYVGAGLGVQYVRYDLDVPANLPSIPGLPAGAGSVLREIAGDRGDWVLAYQAGAGVGYRLMGPLTVHVGYRYMGRGRPRVSGAKVKSDAGNHVLRAGVRIGF